MAGNARSGMNLSTSQAKPDGVLPGNGQLPVCRLPDGQHFEFESNNELPAGQLRHCVVPDVTLPAGQSAMQRVASVGKTVGKLDGQFA